MAIIKGIWKGIKGFFNVIFGINPKMSKTAPAIIGKVVKEIYMLFNIFVMFFPLFFMVLCAFKTNTEIIREPFAWPSDINVLVTNVTNVWNGTISNVELTPFIVMLKNTVVLTFVPMVIMILCATLCAYAIGRLTFSYKGIIMTFVMLVQTVPYFGYMYPLYFEVNFFNLLDTLAGTSLVLVAVSLPSTIILMIGFFKAFPVAVEEAAMIDGANEFQKFMVIVMPMSISIIGSMIIVNFMGYWNEFAIASLILSSPEHRTINVGMFALKSQMGGVGKKDYIMTLLTLSAIPNLVFFSLFQKSIINGVSLGSVKE